MQTIAGWQPPVFLINSRIHRVIETCDLHRRHPLYRRYGANIAEFPEQTYTLRRLGLLSQGHPSRFLVRSHRIQFRFPFSRAPGLNPRFPLFQALPPFSPLRLSRGLCLLNQATA